MQVQRSQEICPNAANIALNKSQAAWQPLCFHWFLQTHSSHSTKITALWPSDDTHTHLTLSPIICNRCSFACPPACLPACLPVCLLFPTFLDSQPTTCLPACLPAFFYLPWQSTTCLPACLPVSFYPLTTHSYAAVWHAPN